MDYFLSNVGFTNQFYQSFVKLIVFIFNIFDRSIKNLTFLRFIWFQLIHLNQSHYDDIVEERAITKLCGYPLCVNKLGDVLKQQYKISLAKHKVFDITERKSFCSDQCYKASLYLKEQILTSPLWVRAEDDILPEFKLLNLSDDEKQNKVKIPEMKSVELPVAKTKC